MTASVAQTPWIPTESVHGLIARYIRGVFVKAR